MGNCEQEPTFMAINATLTDLKSSNKELLKILTVIAEQGAYIESLQEKSGEHEGHIDTLYDRVRLVEIRFEGITIKLGLLVIGASAVMGGIASWLAYNL